MFCNLKVQVVSSCTERNPIGRRTQSNRTADASGDKSITYAHAKLSLKALIVIKLSYDIAEV